ncbi:MAG TPA: porin [Thermoanaerobaculia bacterium]
MRVARTGIFVFLVVAALCAPAFADQATSAAPAPTAPAATAASDPQTTTSQPSSTQTTPSTPTVTKTDAQPQTAAPKPAAPGPLQIKVSDTVNFRFGLLLQPQADFQENNAGGTGENLMLRRVRFIASGQLAKPVFFFFQTENSRLGGAIGTANKVISTGFQTIDAVAEYRYSKPLNIQAGLIYLPTSREALKSSGSEYMIDVNTYAFTATGALGGTAGRDTGFLLRGYFLGDHLEYRAGAFSGLRDATSRNTFRKIARVQYNFLDTEPYALPSYPGAYFGTKRIVALGAAYDGQHNYRGDTADLYWDLPTGFGSWLGTLSYMMLDGKNFTSALPKSNIYVADVGAFAKAVKLGPWLRYEQRNFAAPNSNKDEKRYWAGLNWYPLAGAWNTFNVKAGWSETKPAVGRNTRDITLQLQFFIY